MLTITHPYKNNPIVRCQPNPAYNRSQRRKCQSMVSTLIEMLLIFLSLSLDVYMATKTAKIAIMLPNGTSRKTRRDSIR